MTLTKEEAKNMNILDVANSLGMNMLKSSRNEYYWDEHDSFKINTSKNMFRWYSKDIGGDVIQMVQTLRGVSFREAINYLDTGHFEEAKVQEVTREPFKYLLEKYETNFDNGRRYLKEIRGLSDNTIDFFLKEKALALVNRKYQDGYSEQVLVFKYFDDNKNIIGGALQGIVPNKDRYEGKGYLKQIIYNSDGTAGVNVTVGEEADRLIFFEAPIDMMSYYELNKHNLNNVKLISMDGLKESTVARYLTEHIITDEVRKKTLDFSNAVGYMNFIIKDTDYFDNNKNTDVITLAVDNDSAGRSFIEKLEKIGLKFQTELPPQLENKEKTDWNEVLIVQKKLEKSKGEINMEQNTGNKTRKEFLQKLVDSKKLTQWTKNQQYYFVKGLKKVAVKLENGELRLSKKYPPKNDDEKQYIKDLLEGKDVTISEIRLQQLPENTPKEEKEKIIIENLAYGNDAKGLNEHLKMGLKEYVNSDQYKKYLDTISKFHNYSRRNIDLIYQQKPDATLIAGAKKWNESFERYINKGEKGFTIYAPSEYKVKDLNGDFVLDKDGKVTTNVKEAVSIITDYLSKEQEKTSGSNLLKAYDKTTMKTPDYKDVKIAFRVTEPQTSDRILINKAQISKHHDEFGKEVKDRDSTPNKWNEGEDDQDIEKVRVRYFDLSLRKWVTQVIVIEDGKQKVKDTGHYTEQDPEPVVKVEVNKKRLKNTVVKFRYSIRVKNEGEIEGYAKEISDYIPSGLKFNKADNPDWVEKDGKIVTTKLKDTLLKPGETAEVTVLLTWINGEENMKVMTNTAEISEDYNKYKTPDRDSKPNNKKKGEDDQDDAPVTVTTVSGSTPVYIGIAVTGIAIIAIGGILVKRYI